MRFSKFSSFILSLSLLAVPLLLIHVSLTGTAMAQNTVSGEITGTVTDATGAVVPRASVTLINSDLGVKSVSTTNASGIYRFPLLRPSTYQVSITAQGFGTTARTVVVNLGQITPANVTLGVSGKTEIIQVVAESELIHTESANMAETVDSKQVQLLPNSGNDLTNYALTTPGITLSTGGGYGNFTSNGIGGMSNLYTINGNDYNDAYLNLNNSGASNMLLGSNEVQEATVVTNGYTAQYGRMAGANLNFTTKAGSNSWHGDANWTWNGTALNANDWYNKPNGFNGNVSTPRPHAVSNQWAGDVGGPVLKDKIFFYYDNEGIRYVLPSGGAVDIPSPAFQTAVLANLAAVSPSSVNYYTKAFNVYKGSPSYSRAIPVDSTIDSNLGCGDIYSTDSGTGVQSSSIAGLTAYTTPCALQFQDTTNNLNVERLQTARVDWNLTDKDKLNFRYKDDRGTQATSTDPINSAFSANSVQPQDEGQVNWTRIINGNMVNQFIASDLYYSAKFGPPNFAGATAVFPTSLAFSDGLFYTLGGGGQAGPGFSNYPSGRKVDQYQFVDDFTWTKGSHGLKLGANFRRDNISDYAGSPLTTGLVTNASLTSFASGIINGGNLAQRFTKAPEVPVAYFSLGLYAQDEWRVNRKLKLTYGIRFDRNSNENCVKNCFYRPGSTFSSMDHSASTPYNTTLKPVKTAFPGLEFAVWGPRGGFDWTPFGDKTVIRGGMGLFSDLYPGVLGDAAIRNLPNVVSFTIKTGPLSPDAAGNVWTQASANNSALQSAYSAGGTLASIQSALPSFTPPNLNVFATSIKNPKYIKWNFEIEQSFGEKTALSVNYVGNHGYDLFLTTQTFNSYCSAACASHTLNPSGTFEDLPTSAPDTRFANVTDYENGGIANYNGLTVSLTQHATKGFTGSLNYTWSHTLDELYEGGIEPLNNLNNPSLRTVSDVKNIRKYNYGNADQDVRHLITANFYWELPFKTGDQDLNQVIGGWVLSGTIQSTTGTPFSAYYTTVGSSLLGNASSARVLAQMNIAGTGSCGRPDANNPCFKASQFQVHKAAIVSPATPEVPYQAGWAGGSNTRRNQFRGPGYFDTDLSLSKNIRVTEKGVVLTIGAEAINFLNHPNFDRPYGSLSSGSFGKITETVGQPNSPYGNFTGSSANGRIIESNLKIRF